MLEPVPETKKALAEYLSLHEPDLDEMLHILGERAQRIVPPLVALSLGLIEEGVTFTLASSNLLGSMLDAAQYVSDEGPCLAAVEDEDTVVTDVEDLLDEGRWHLYAQSAAVEGVASSLSMPIFRDGRVIGGVNLYASAPGAFVGKEEALADALGASAEYAVANADLSFSTRWEAAQAPAHLRARKDIDTAVGLLSVRYEEGIPAARERIRSAAARSGLDEAVLARAIVAVHAAQSG